MNDADFKRLNLSRLHTMADRERTKLLQAMTPAQQKQAIGAISAAFVNGSATPKHSPTQAPSNVRAEQVYAKRRESVAGQNSANQANAAGVPAFGSEAHVSAVYAKRRQGSGGNHAADFD